jgi:hypothetical protein
MDAVEAAGVREFPANLTVAGGGGLRENWGSRSGAEQSLNNGKTGELAFQC